MQPREFPCSASVEAVSIASRQQLNKTAGLAASAVLKRKQLDDTTGRASKIGRLAEEHISPGKPLVASNYRNFLKSGLPRRIMFYSDGEWTDFPKKVTTSVVDAFAAKRSSIQILIDEVDHVLDFFSMVAINLENGNQQSLAWIDEADKCFFPMVLFEEKSSPKLVLDRKNSNEEASGSGSSRVSGTGWNHICLRVKEEVAENENLPSEGLPLKPELEKLERGNKLFLSVMESFLSGMGNFAREYNVLGIYQYVPKAQTSLHRQEMFERQRKTRTSQNGITNEFKGWLGSAKETLARVLSHGFFEGLKQSNEASFGTCISLAPENRSFACAKDCDVDEKGLQYMLLCRVIMENKDQLPIRDGQHKLGPDNKAHSPLSRNLSIMLDPRFNNHVQPSFVVCFKLAPAIRDYFAKLAGMGGIGFVTSRNQPENNSNCHATNVSGSGSATSSSPTSPWTSFTTLFSEIGDKIPAVAKELLNYHHEEYKLHLIKREELVWRMRLIVGDKLLKYALGRLQQNPSSHPNNQNRDG